MRRQLAINFRHRYSTRRATQITSPKRSFSTTDI